MDSSDVSNAEAASRRDALSREARARLLEGQNEILRLVTTGAMLPVVLDRIARVCETLLPGSLCSILLADERLVLRHGAAPSLATEYCSAVDGVQAAPGVGSCGTAVAEKRLVVVADIATHPYWTAFRRHALAHGLRACWSTCIKDGSQRALGSFAVYYREPREPDAAALEVIEGMRGLAAIAIERHEAAQRQATLIRDLNQQRLRAEAAVARFRESEQRFRDLTSASSDWYWEQDENLRFTFASASSWPESGIDAARLYGRTLRETGLLGVGEDELRRHEEDLARRRPFRDFRYQRLDDDGQVHHVSINGVPVFDEATGAFKGYRGTGRNITAEVRRSELFRALIDAVPAMINVKDRDSRYVLMNAYQARLYGTTPEAAVGKTAGELLGLEYGSYTGALDRRVIESGEPTGFFEETYAGVDGVRRHWLAAKLPLKDMRGQVRHVISIAMDITTQKQTEQQLRASQQALREALVQVERASRAKSDFLTNMSHELRTPLNAIIGFSELLAGEMMGPLGSVRYREYAQDIYRSGRYLHDLISDMLDMAKIEAGKRDLALEAIDAAAEIEDAIRMLRPRAEAGAVSLETDLGAAPRAFLADRRAFRQILLNLVGNAVKFTPAGGKVSVRMGRAGDDLVLSVTDTGIGIAEEQIARLGTPFFRIEDPQQATTEGTGLGLALTKSLVRLHGWHIRFESRIKRGTVVTVVMPGQAVDTGIARRGAATAA